MALQRDHQLFSGLALNGVYWTFGAIELRIFDETARLELWPYLSEDLRRQKLTEEQQQLAPDARLALLTPIRLPELQPKVVYVPGNFYRAYFSASAHSGEGLNIIDAAWRYVTEVPEPHGLKDWASSAVRI